MTGMQNVRQIYENGQIWSNRLQANQRETARQKDRGRREGRKQQTMLRIRQSNKQSDESTIYRFVRSVRNPRELAFSSEDEIKPYADFILITMLLPHSAWQSGMAKLDQLRATSA